MLPHINYLMTGCVSSCSSSFFFLQQHLSKQSKDLTTRERKQVVPSMKDESSWFKFCLGGTLAEADGSLEKKATSTAKIIESLEGMSCCIVSDRVCV